MTPRLLLVFAAIATSPFGLTAEEVPFDLEPNKIIQMSKISSAWLCSVRMDVHVTKGILGEGRRAVHTYQYCQEGEPLRGGRVAWDGEITAHLPDGSVWESGCMISRALLGHEAYPDCIMMVSGPRPLSGPLIFLRIEADVPGALMHFREDPKSGFFLDGWLYGNGGRTVADLLSEGLVVCDGTETLPGGEECLILRRTEDKYTITAWIAVRQECLLVKYLVERTEMDQRVMPSMGILLERGQQWYAESTISRVADIDGSFVPVEGHLEYGVIENGGRTPVGHVVAVRKNVVLRPDHIDEQSFEIAIPDRTSVYFSGENGVHGSCYQWQKGEVVKVTGPHVPYRIAAVTRAVRQVFAHATDLLSEGLYRPAGFTFALGVVGIAAIFFGSGVLVGLHIRRLGNASSR